MRELSLKIERLTELSTDDLAAVAGGVREAPRVDAGAMTYRGCTTAMSCGCEITWNCQTLLC